MTALLLFFFVLALCLATVIGTYTVTVNKTISGAGGTIIGSDAVTDNELVTANPSVLASQAGTLTTRTNTTSGTLTMTSGGHGIITGQRVDLYWASGKIYNAVVGTVSGTSVPIASVGGGDVLPATSTAIQVGISKSTPFNMTGDNLTALILSTPVSGYIIVASNSADLYVGYVAATKVFTWTTSDIATNPLAGVTPTKVWMSHGETTAQAGMQAAALVH